MEDSFTLARKIYDSGYRPTVQATLLWGGVAVGNYVYNFLKDGLGVDIREHLPVRCRVSYESQEELDNLEGMVAVDTGIGFMDLLRAVKPNDKLLIVDEVCQTTSTLLRIRNDVLRQYGNSTRPQVRTVVLHFKPEEARSNYQPDFYLHETNDWVVYSWGIDLNMSDEEIVRFWGPKVLGLLRAEKK